MLKINKILTILFTISLISVSILAQQEKETISRSEKEVLVIALCERIEKIYIFTEKTKNICDRLKENLQKGEYEKFVSPREFATRLDEDIRGVTHDLHFGIVYDPQQAAEMAAQAGKSTAFYTPQLVRQFRRLNYGFKEVKILEGNVGYLDLRDFFPLQWSADPAVAAMNLLSNCDAVIIDLRFNGGGEDSTVTFLLSYFLDSRESTINFNTSYTRYNNSYYQAATWPYVPGKTLYDMPLYLLTSKTSFSGAEAFAFRLKNLKRATLIGETTRGGANPVEIQEIGGKYVVYIPSTKNVSSMTDSDWEGVGVKPDIEVTAAQAPAVAHKEALKYLAAKAAGEEQRSYYNWTLAGVQAKSRQLAVKPAILQAYVGSYGERAILFEQGELFYKRGERTKLRMVPMSENLFLIETVDSMRLRFVKETDDTYRMESLYDDGRVAAYPKSVSSESN